MGGELLTISALTETSPEMHVHIAVLQLKALQVFRTFTASVAIGHQSDLAKAAGSSGTHQAAEGLPLALKRFVQERMCIHQAGREQLVRGVLCGDVRCTTSRPRRVAEGFQPAISEERCSTDLNGMSWALKHLDGVEQQHLGHRFWDFRALQRLCDREPHPSGR